MKCSKIITLAIPFRALSGLLTTLIILNFQQKSQNDPIKDLYLTENAVHVTASGLLYVMGNNLSFTKIVITVLNEKESNKIYSDHCFSNTHNYIFRFFVQAYRRKEAGGID